MDWDASPYIPEKHRQYDLLPFCRAEGGEVFSYPPELLNDIDERLAEREQSFVNERGTRAAVIYPYGESSYSSYYEKLESYAAKYREIDPELSADLLKLEETMKAMNVKENWSVVRYVGKSIDSIHGPTHGRCYYWPCSIGHPDYEGVVDDEEFTSYLYPCDPDCWEILEDPTGMAARALAGQAHAGSFWMIDSGMIRIAGQMDA